MTSIIQKEFGNPHPAPGPWPDGDPVAMRTMAMACNAAASGVTGQTRIGDGAAKDMTFEATAATRIRNQVDYHRLTQERFAAKLGDFATRLNTGANTLQGAQTAWHQANEARRKWFTDNGFTPDGKVPK